MWEKEIRREEKEEEREYVGKSQICPMTTA